jgi:hypothetical protein
VAEDFNEAEQKSPLLSGWMIVPIVAVAAVGITAVVKHSTSSSGVSTATKSPIRQSTTTQTHSTTTQPVPMVLVCSATPQYKPGSGQVSRD